MIVNLPLSVPIGKKDDKFYINLNQYRNAHYHTLNSAKIAFKELIADQVNKLPKLNIIKLWYRVYASSKRKLDTNNVCSIADKFFCDALVEAGKLDDDNYDFIIDTRFSFGGIDKGNPRVEVEIEETAPMKMIFDKAEILIALNQYAASVLKFPPEQMPEVTLEATSDGSFYAALNLDMTKMQTAAAKPTYRSTAQESTDEALSAIKAKAATSGSRQAVSAALQGVKQSSSASEAQAEQAADKPTEKPSLLKTTPKAESRAITPPAAVEDASTAPTESQDAATTAEATLAAPVDTPAGNEAEAEPVNDAEGVAAQEPVSEPEEKAQITESPEDRKEAAKPAGQIGGAPAAVKEAPKSIFNFKK